MPKINVLTNEIAQLIAAGEVVERPASVIKELVENSIDSGATTIEVEIKNGGTTFMRVTDNGCGIDRKDIKTAFFRHATSKVLNESDLNKIGTLGFRGEALASISAVSKVHIISKTKDSENGTSYEISGEVGGDVEDIGCPNGTTILVEDLFFNTPARLKFLKKDISESNAIANVMDKIALSNSQIAVRFIRDGKITLNTPGNDKLKSAIYAVYGKDFTSQLMDVEYDFEGIKVSGYISKPTFARANRNMQNFFINGRYVKSRTAMAALEQAFKGSIMVGKFPSCVLHICIDPTQVDVNVHPAKIEVRFANEKPLFQAVYHAVKSAIINKDTRKTAEIFENRNMSTTINKEQENTHKAFNIDNNLKQNKIHKDNKSNTYQKEEFLEPEVFVPSKQTLLHDATTNTQFIKDWYLKQNEEEQVEPKINIQSENNKKTSDAIKPNVQHFDQQTLNINSYDVLAKDEKSVYIGEAFKSYLIIEKQNEIILIDKHAAHERLLYEKLKSQKIEQLSQILLDPVIVTLEKNEYAALLENKLELSKLGFDIDDFGGDKVAVRTTPLEIDNIKDTIIEIAGYLLQNKSDITPKKMDWVYHNVACRAAIKAGDNNNRDELIKLALTLKKNPDIRYCPHGRPVSIAINKKDIEKQFGR